MKNYQTLSYRNISIHDTFWTPRLKINSEKAIFHQWDQLEKTRCIDNFRIASELKQGFREGFFFSDSDAYKWLDAASRIYTCTPSEKLKLLIDNFLDIIKEAQSEDGYLFTYNQINFPTTRWKNLWIEHEFYCLGHLIEALISYYKIESNKEALNVAIKSADLIINEFMDKGTEYISGHQEIEIALLELYKITNSMKYLEMTRKFIEKRGRGKLVWWNFLRNAISTSMRMRTVAKRKRKFLEVHPEENDFRLPSNVQVKIPKGMKYRSVSNFASGKYMQHHKPIREQLSPEGHSVRFAYNVTAAAMLARELKDESLLKSLENLWDQMVKKRMYPTGGIGSLPVIEGFGNDFELHPEYAYCETCAAIASLYWNWEMTLLTGSDAKYADLFEWELYNAVSVGIGFDGTSYFYRNPLTSRDISFKRREWFKIPCCPSNLSRTYASLGKYIYSYNKEAIWIHQYIGNSVKIPRDVNSLNLKIESGIPWVGNVRIDIFLRNPEEFQMNLRIPSWASTWSIEQNGCINTCNNTVKEDPLLTASGYSPYSSNYYTLKQEWDTHNSLVLTFPIKIKLLQIHPKSVTELGNTVITRGPIVYCLESIDNPTIDIFNIIIDPNSLESFYSPTMNGYWKIKGKTDNGKEFIAIPYYLWGNRNESKMNVIVKSII